MNTINEIKNLKCKPNKLFENEYRFLIECLTDYYISKMDGKDRIKEELKKWDWESQKFILNDLKNHVESCNVHFEWN